MVTRQAVLLCTALWRVVNLCHLGTIGCTYCSFFMCLWHLEHTVSQTGSMNESRMSLSSLPGSLWYDVCILAHPFSIEIFTSVISHPQSSFTLYTCLPVPPYLALTLCQILYSPRFPTEASSRQACPVPAPENG